MSAIDPAHPGKIIWTDLTVPDADAIQQFYSHVVGWTAEPVSMGACDDYNMLPPGSETPAAGICWARDSNADLPAQWLVYIVVADVEASVARCLELGGTVVSGPRDMGDGRFCVIRDPAGAVAALYKPGGALGA